jgi:phage baseplate assembly protein V
MDTEVMRALFQSPQQNGAFFGVVVGVVTNNQDPEGMHRVKVRLPWLCEGDESNWARVAASMAGGGRGAYFLPEVDDEVVVAFEHGRIDHPFVLGSLWNGADEPPESNADGENNNRSIKSRSGHLIRLNDKSGGETIEIVDKSGNNSVVIDTAANSITIKADGDITIQSASGKLTMKANGVEVESQAGVSIQAAQGMDLNASGQVTVKGATINLN